jgi:inner membrane protein
MLSKTHIINGISFVSITLLFNTHYQLLNIKSDNNIYIYTGAILGSILPDIDHPKSWISKLSPVPVHRLFKHRGITHSKILILIVFLCGYLLKSFFVQGLTIGLLSHSIMDLINTKFNKKEFCENVCFYLSWFIILVCILFENVL